VIYRAGACESGDIPRWSNLGTTLY